VGQERVQYEIPIPGNGQFTLITKHAESLVQDPNKRVFNVYLGGKLVHSNVDLFKEMGFKSGFNTYVEFEVKGSSILVEGEEMKDVIYRKNNLVRLIAK
jgi:hypothetical protein